MSSRQSNTFSIPLFAAMCLVALLVCGCRSTVDRISGNSPPPPPSPSAPLVPPPPPPRHIETSPPDAWERHAPVDYDGSGKELDHTRWRSVLDSKETLARTMLQTDPFISLTEKQAFDLAGKFPPSIMQRFQPFLIRAVSSHIGTAGFEIYLLKNGDLVVIGGALSHHDVPPERRPIVVWLARAPHELCVEFSVAE